MTYGWNASAYQILNPGIEYWFSKDVGAVVGYVLRGGYVRVAGGPVCAADALPRVVTARNRSGIRGDGVR
jgi:hypothetical protein